MRRRRGLVAVLLLAMTSIARAQDDPDAWTPGADMIAELDAQAVQLELRGASGPLDGYQRYYRGTKQSGRLFVEGYFGPFQTEGRKPDSDELPAKVHIVAHAEPSVSDAGCGVVFLRYDVSSESFTSIQCEGGPGSSSR